MLRSLPKAGASSNIEIRWIPITIPKHHPKNPRDHSEENIQAIIRSLSEFGTLQPLVLWSKDNYVIVGNGRLEAMRRLGKTTIPTVRADHLSEEQALAYMIADNKTTDMSAFNETLLAEIMQGIAANTQAIEATGFSTVEIEPLLTADLPDIPDGFGDVAGPDRVENIDAKGSSEVLGRVILVFDTPEERAEICKLLGLDSSKDTKQTFSFSEIPALRPAVGMIGLRRPPPTLPLRKLPLSRNPTP